MNTLERTVSLGLRAGVTLSALVVGLGGVAYLATYGGQPPVFVEPPAAMRSVAGIVRGVLGGQSERIIALGILLLIATPVLRVALLVVAMNLVGDGLNDVLNPRLRR